ncbi:DUF1573 domain-containing protein [Spirosoma radiotolerans]|uniref:DUF1573 domain-containing protein n=1 Tax=Spirosoma radiotolerans TaxID=1379870 RepID=A0A0E3V8D1_9BACT|nr:DUF1573 domain-containing protein [Spirosoma radiotolerans]AKD56652.1 hypothetical protein SD10_18855 [Spirosoma radiotolerans]
MKRILFFASLILLTASIAMTVPAALFNWRSATHDFGRIAQGKPVTAEYTFTNTGELPLVINSAKGSCGCTGVDYPKGAVLPGQTGKIKATFNAAALGAFNKTVLVESNAEGGSQTLYLKGEVVKEAASAQ